uniref:Contactin associated protein like 3 n=1 Tax=Gasterosteus aculeatus aculeatus TaxID=481459 RepID=A0AAQ4NSJ6_GASAC
MQFISQYLPEIISPPPARTGNLINDSYGYQWLEVDLGQRTKIAAVATQGRYGSSDWLTSYLLMFSDTGHNWKQHRQEDSIGSFPGNSNADSVVQYKLQQPAVARFLRLLPLRWNPSGRMGLRLEAYGCPHTSDVLSLRGGGLAYRLSPGPRRSSGEVVSLEFKTARSSGTLLQAEGEGGLGLSLELERGKLLLLTRGTERPPSSEPRRVASLGSLLDDQQWHRLAVERRGSQLNVTVDEHAAERLRLPAEFPASLAPPPVQLSVAAARGLVSERNFDGCLENLVYNGLDLVELFKSKDRRVTVGNVTFSCAESVSVAVTFPGPRSFLRLPGAAPSLSEGVSVGLQFRTWNDAGLLLTFDLPEEGGVAWLYLSEARLRLQIHKAGGALLELSAGSALNDGLWHSVELTSGRGRLTIAVDTEERGVANAGHPVAAGSQLFFGGCPAAEDTQDCKNPFGVFQGCMRLLRLEDQPVDLIKVQQRLLGNYSHLQIDMCGIIDRCSPSRCEHGGRCTQSWTAFRCNCSASGYSGATCHSSVYEQSCEAYKHNGNTSGHFYIDVDGSGPIRPQLVYCNMTEENTWMEIRHNNTELTGVRPSAGVDQHSVHFDYSAEEEQLLAAISQSEHCEQELSYRCRKSRLLNTPEGSPFSWWLGGPGPGRVQTYWGGAQPGSRQCACGLRGDCVDPQHYCNCDADRTDWAEDSGLLTHEESLPVRSLVLGDIQRAGSEAAYRVGPLRCYGDKNFWNAAFFDKETSYLHFPTFHGELSADISFLFKTTASSGVFLENLGIKDFIRIELSSSTRVVFSLDVGDGPLEVRVESSVPLNDDRWHRVRAERNVREASLRLDALPAARRGAPADGHLHLQLNSQLFIGGTASRQKGFRGCIRALQLNGVTLDLEERARITPGVRAGCPGHCGSYGSLCRNRGRCAERANGFLCDCGLSAHTGAFCHTEVSASFLPGTTVSYTFKQPHESGRNSSARPSSVYSDTTLRGEDVSLSFRTNQSPALLLYVSSHHGESLALLINKHGEEAFILKEFLRGSLTLLSPGSEDVDPELSPLASLGFTGCLSVVRFNPVSPLKAALLSSALVFVPLHVALESCCCFSPVGSDVLSGVSYFLPFSLSAVDQSGSAGSGQPLVNAVRTDSALIGGVIAVAIFLIASGLALTARFLYRRKETYGNQEAGGVKQEDSGDFTFTTQRDSQSVSTENPKEYFI